MSKWSALSGSHHPSKCHHEEATVEQEAAQVSKTLQSSEEHIIIRDSCEVHVHTTDTKAAVNLQVALQLAVALVLSITIADSDDADHVAQELLQKVSVKQVSNQRTLIENSRNVRVTTTDTDVAVNIQVLLQLLVALVAKLDIL
ncbi:spore coat protein [Tumebacillus sp. ITR2]|uniref:Spore coat protein n=1 Tax=Tumebacillus amylolyticus TaxID=2801339 RepID=A0ABS1J8D8_9BACL|nr:spore coat protein [Tumebacillus amylolyticus]MBL0386530.1 spore coat protein [Tumebacillus amylolyticus]